MVQTVSAEHLSARGVPLQWYFTLTPPPPAHTPRTHIYTTAHCFVGVTKKKCKDLFERVERECPDCIREFKSQPGRYATLTFQYEDLQLGPDAPPARSPVRL